MNSDFSALNDKLSILGMSAKYDASCSSSGSSRKNPGGSGNAVAAGICHSWGEDGRCISLLKVLQTNICSFDCAYCINRKSNDIPRALFSPAELADLTMQFYKRNYIEGLFLSSAVLKNSDYSMELMLKTVSLLRNVHRFGGYIHLKVMPGADPLLIKRAGFLVDRISANIELPTGESLSLLAPDKKPDKLIGSIKDISSNIRESVDEYRFKRSVTYAPGGQSTQMIIGATPDTDKTILNLTESLYKKLSLKRVYYSAYVPVTNSSLLPALTKPPLLREHRLYQADWLLRFYGFKTHEILNDEYPNLDMRIDPKTAWAMRNYHLFPVEISTASYEEILRIPGIGVQSAQRIIKARRFSKLTFEDLKKIGVVMKRAKYFLSCGGKMMSSNFSHDLILAEAGGLYSEIKISELREGQLPLFREQSIPPIEIAQEI